jgi:hypothetical protein
MYPIFATAWALAVLFHLATPHGAERNAVSALLLVAALGTILLPGNSLALVMLAACQIAQFWERLPMRAQTSEYFKFICGLCLIATYIPLAWAQGTASIATDLWFASFAPLLRLATSLLFFASVLHKLNAGFFSPERSHARKIVGPLISTLGLPSPRWLLATLPYATVLGEFFIAAGLLFPATRAAAVWTLLLMFFAVGLRGVVQFAWLMYAVGLLFCDDRVAARAMPYVATTFAVRHALFALACCVFFPAAIVLRRRAAALLLLVSTVVMALALFAWSAAAVTGAPAPMIWTGASLPLSSAQIVLLVLFSLNELGPYVGYKDWPTFRMYSNLESGFTINHLFLRAWLFTPFFKRRQEVLLSPSTVKLIPYQRFRAGGDLYLPYSSLAVLAREFGKAGGLPLPIEAPNPGSGAATTAATAATAAPVANTDRTASSWLDVLMPPRFFFHYPCSRPPQAPELKSR